jgi:hypothetical protein
MAHVLARLREVPLADIERILRNDAPQHAAKGLYLEHLRQNADDPDEVLFLFRVDDLDAAKRFIEAMHENARRQAPDARLPDMTFLEGT